MRWLQKRYCLAVMGEESHTMVPLSFHAHRTLRRASSEAERLNLKREGHSTHFAVWDRRDRKVIWDAT